MQVANDFCLKVKIHVDVFSMLQIVDVETKEFLFYINATNPHSGNWMRNIKCARFFEEQNIVSEQEGIDIFYQAIKVISSLSPLYSNCSRNQ